MRLETFLVRIWTGADSDGDSTSTGRQPDPEEPAGEGRLTGATPASVVSMQGLVRHVRSGRQSTFGSEADLLAILRSSVTQASSAPGPDVPVEPLAIGKGR